MRLIILTGILIIPDITKTKSNNCFKKILYLVFKASQGADLTLLLEIMHYGAQPTD